MSPGVLETTAAVLVALLVAVLGVRTALAERAAGHGGRTGAAWSRPATVWWLDVAAVALTVLGVATLVTVVVLGAVSLP